MKSTKRPCTICVHPKRKAIELAVKTKAERKVAAEFEISRDALHRHVVNHTQGLREGNPISIRSLRRKAIIPSEQELQYVAEEMAGATDEEDPDAPPIVQPPAPPPPPAVFQAAKGDPESWINILADTIALGKFNGRETILAIAAKAQVSRFVAQSWAKEAARRVEQSWGNAEQAWQVSIAEWRRQLKVAQETNDLKAAGVAQAGLDKVIAAMPKRVDLPADDENVAQYKTHEERRRYLIDLFRTGRFHGLQTTGHLTLAWSDLKPFEFAELVTLAATELRMRNGSHHARRLVLVGILEKCTQLALKQEDARTAARLAETWAKIDQLTPDADIQTAAMNNEVMRLVANALQRHPAAMADVHDAILTAEAQKRAALAPMLVQPTTDAE